MSIARGDSRYLDHPVFKNCRALRRGPKFQGLQKKLRLHHRLREGANYNSIHPNDPSLPLPKKAFPTFLPPMMAESTKPPSTRLRRDKVYGTHGIYGVDQR